MPTNVEYGVLDLVKNAQEKNAVEFNKAIDHILQVKAAQAIERKREEIAQKMFNTEIDDTTEDDIEIDDEEIEDINDEDLDDADIEIDDEENQESDEDTEEDLDDTENKDA
jgi:hypothetical protein